MRIGRRIIGERGARSRGKSAQRRMLCEIALGRRTGLRRGGQSGSGASGAANAQARPMPARCSPGACRRCRRGRPGREIRRSQRHAAGQVSRRRRVRQPTAICGLSRSAAAGSPICSPTASSSPVVNCNPPDDIGQTCEPQGTRWHDGKLYLTTRHRGILTYDPKTKELKTLVYTYRNQLFKGPNDLDFDAEGNLFFTDPWATGPGPNMSDRTGAVYQYSKDGILRKVIDDLHFPNGIAVSPDNSRLAIGDCTASRMVYAIFATGPTLSNPGAKPDPLHLTFQTRPGRHLSARQPAARTGCITTSRAICGSPRPASAVSCRSIRAASSSALCRSRTAILRRPISRSAARTTGHPSWAPTAARSGASRRPIPA